MKATKTSLLAIIFALGGCGGGEPSESDISGAIEKQLKSQLESSAGVLKEEDLTINSIKKIGCKEAEGSSGYNCDIDVDIDIKMPFIGKQKQKGVQTLRFVKTDEGWSAVAI